MAAEVSTMLISTVSLSKHRIVQNTNKGIEDCYRPIVVMAGDLGLAGQQSRLSRKFRSWQAAGRKYCGGWGRQSIMFEA